MTSTSNGRQQAYGPSASGSGSQPSGAAHSSVMEHSPTTACPAARPSPAPLFLLVLHGPRAGAVYPIGRGGCTIGRCEDADLRLSAAEVSNSHAMIMRNRDGSARIIDCQSTHGTFVDGRRVEVERLRGGARIRLGGEVVLLFHERNPATEPVMQDQQTRPYGAA